MGSVVRVYPGPPFTLVNVVLVVDEDPVRRSCDNGVDERALADRCRQELFPINAFANWGCSSAGRAPALQAGGQRFDPAQLHHFVSSRAVRTFGPALRTARRTIGAGPWPCEALLRWRRRRCCLLKKYKFARCHSGVCACSAKIVKRRLIWRLPGSGFTRV